MSNIKVTTPELLPETSSPTTDKKKVTGTYNAPSDKFSMDISSKELSALLDQAAMLNEKLAKILIILGEISGIEEGEL